MEKTEIKKNTAKKTSKTSKTVADSVSMEALVYGQNGKEISKFQLPQDIFALPWNADLVHQVVVSMQSNARATIAHAKDRSEVSGGGKKPWQQKGTGRARHGSIRSPLWVGGGKAHGPHKEKDYSRKINKKMKNKALMTILSRKVKDGKVLFIDSIDFKEPKKSEAKKTLTSFSKIEGFGQMISKKNNSAMIALDGKKVSVQKSFANFNNLLTDEARNINPVDLMKYNYLVVSNPEHFLNFLMTKLNK